MVVEGRVVHKRVRAFLNTWGAFRWGVLCRDSLYKETGSS